ncbi:hypothetical protein RDI58_020584 [Solanum bulbocastanum]|uniref:Uncharacterized protein n=1 Tax=Solanum bulbocastanum TaxID=147425 RepID=A0AAN8YAU0_SOLBU
MAPSRLVSFAKKIIKPNSPTPLSLGRYNRSLFDQFMVPVYVPIAAFYPFLLKHHNKGAKFVNVQYDCPMYEVVNLPDTGPEYLPFPKASDHNANIPSPQMIGSSIFSPSTVIHMDTMIIDFDNIPLIRKSFIQVETMSDDEMTIARVVCELRKAKDELKEDHVKEKKLASVDLF